MAAAVYASDRSVSSSLWNEGARLLRKVGVIALEALKILFTLGATLAFLAFSAAYPTVFTGCILSGFFFHDSLEKGFDQVYGLYNYNWVTRVALPIILAIEAVYTFPLSMCIFGLWIGHRIAALSEHIRRDAAQEYAAARV